MNRREFLKTGTAATLAGTSIAGCLNKKPKATARQSQAGKSVPDILITDAKDHRRRLQHIAFCEKQIRRCMRKHMITSYLPGQCSYNIGEYPCRKPWNPDAWDERELDRLVEHGIRLIQLHGEWPDWLRLFGGDFFHACNPSGLRRFVTMVHDRGMKLILYTSTGFYERRDRDFQSGWARNQDLVELYYDCARCSPASPSWRAYVIPKIIGLLDEYGVDGIYNDLGYVQMFNNPQPATEDEILAFPETPDNDGALGDMLGLIYTEVKRRGGIVKIHYGAADAVKTLFPVYDYLWVGETVTNGDKLRQASKNFNPYIVPCLDMSRAKIENENELYMHTIPYMQFPLLLAGRPFTGERALIPGVKYQPEETDFWTHHCRAIWKYYQQHPDGPYTYGWWDSSPGRPEAQPTHARWLKQYQPMVVEGTWAWLEINDSDLFTQTPPADVAASAFANRDLYLVLANYGAAPARIVTTDDYTVTDELFTPAAKEWTLPGRSLKILRRSC
jgi:hypothetical protein